jgi:hypothetical protein
MSKGFKRIHLRSPLMSSVLYESEGHVHRAMAVNISQGGLLLENLPHVPDIQALPLMFPLPLFPLFSQLPADSIKNLRRDDLDVLVIRARARMVRSFEGQSEVDRVFVQKIGCEFVVLSDEDREQVGQYVATFASNIVYLLSLFQRSSQLDQLRDIAALLGYQREEKIPLLRQKILHDYQSLESL